MDQENDNTLIMSTTKPQTYIAIGDITSGLLEIDLVTLRQKNDEIRYLALSFSGTNAKTEKEQESFINIENEEQFNALKKFFAQLDWNS